MKKKTRCIGEITPFSECLSIAQDDISKDQFAPIVKKSFSERHILTE